MTPTKEVPTWEELVERMARWSRQRDDRESLDAADRWLRHTLGLTPEILEDARAVAWVEEQDADASRISHLSWAVSADRGASFYGEAPTLREAVAKAKEEEG